MVVGLNNRTLKIVFAIGSYFPYLNVTTNSNNITHYTGLIPELLDKLANHLHFKYEAVTPVDRSYGVLVNGSWNGLIGMVARKEVDVAASPLTITEDRKKVVDFSSPFSMEATAILIRFPEKKKSMWNVIFVFSRQVWLIILISIVGAVIILRMMFYFDWYMHKENDTKCALSYCTWHVYGGLINQICVVFLVCKIYATSWSNRIFQLSWRIWAVLLISIYAGCLAAARITEEASLPFTDLKGLTAALERNEYKICVGNSTALYSLIMNARSPEYLIMKNWLVKNPGFVSPSSGCLSVLQTNEKIAMPNEATYLKNIQLQTCVNFSTILLEDRFFPGYFGMAFQKRSPLNSQFSKAITEIVDSGLVEKWKIKYFPRSSLCEIPSATGTVLADLNQLVLKDVGGPFILLLGGLCVGSVAMALEKLWIRKLYD